ncbi:carcinoembryonic antigen-related cell adhesion molecule 5 isoform X2 [Corythoichthys intestinalis]|uniref:carcinoembryonic antigen-related cell adhesion molecule 5 isoform X2 n=1 Tax=Corythoichthys intestinalis TaxID=161448 RepID=UPI0025A67874|nr:carcinoembryonic antigen-related cell adhesion molecule 5 isoform X2 [Corythoichthys intestinalis]
MGLIKFLGVMYFSAVCAAVDYEDVTDMNLSVTSTRAPSAENDTIHEPPVPSLHMLSHWQEVFPFEEAYFECRVNDSSDWTFSWYRNGQPVQDADQNVSLNSSHQALLTITAASQKYSGTYSCKAHHKTKGNSTNSNEIELKVYADRPKPVLVPDPKLEPMFPGESVTFQCMINMSFGWEYLWFHENKKIQGSYNNTYEIVSLALSDNGQYSCEAKRGERPFYTERSKTFTLHVSEPPTPILKLQTSWSDVFLRESVKLTCDVGNPNWKFIWHRNGKALQDDPVIVLSLGSSLLNITSVSRDHQGIYACKAHLETRRVSSALSNTINVTVYKSIPKPSLSKNPVLNSMFVGENVSFTCKVKVGSNWMYHWFKDENELAATNETIQINLSTHNAGTYWCKATRGQSTSTDISDQLIQNVLEIPLPSLTLSSDWADVFPTESVKFSCAMVDSSSWTYTWLRDNQAIPSDSTISFGLDGATLSIGSASPYHGGQYSCSGKLKSRSVISNFTSGLKLIVYENIPKPSLRKDPVLNSMFVGENITFTCKVQVGSDWVYHWFKDKKEVVATNETLQIHLSTHDAGTYWCKATRGQNISTDISDQLIQNVLEIPLPSLTPSNHWADVFPTESVTLRCAMANSSSWTYTWRRDNQVIHSDDTVTFGLDRATLSIRSASPAHGGLYSCSGKLRSRSVISNFTSGLQLTVYDDKPIIQMEQEPEHMVMHTGDSVTYTCHINVSFGWWYMWFKDDTQLTVSGKNYTIGSVDRKNTGSYKCQAARGKPTAIFKTEQSRPLRLKVEERPSANIIVLTGWSEVFSTDSLVLKCEVKGNEDKWNYTWFMEGQWIPNSSSDKYTVTPQNDPKQSQYVCQGIRLGRPSFSKKSDPLTTKNLLLKRRVLLSISGCIFFGILAVFFGCVILRVTRKPAEDDGGPEEAELFLTMAQLKNRDDAPCPLVDYITNEELDPPTKEGVDITCTESNAPLVTLQEDQAVTTESSDRPPEEEGALVSFQH